MPKIVERLNIYSALVPAKHAFLAALQEFAGRVAKHAGKKTAGGRTQRSVQLLHLVQDLVLAYAGGALHVLCPCNAQLVTPLKCCALATPSW